ncbi:MAG: MATE family efflux transporter [Cyclobacteriaceae bacterium]
MSLQSLKIHFRKTSLIAYPIVLSQLGHITVGVADSVMVGELGTEPLAAVSLANSIFSLVLMFGIGVSMAITPLVAAADGEGDLKKSGRIFRHGLAINLLASFVLGLVILLGTQLLPLLEQPERVVELAIPYLLIITSSLLPFMLFQTFKQYAEGLSRTRTAMFITLSANLLNIFFNYLLIYGKWGFPEMGLNGAGVATLISRILMLIAMVVYVKRAPWFNQKITMKKLQKTLMVRILKIGIPTGFQYVFEVGAFSTAAIMMGWLGAQALAAHQIALNLAAVSYMMVTGIAAASTVRVGNQLGMKDIPNMRRAGFSAFLMGLMLMTSSAVLFVSGKYFFPSLYIDEPEVIELAGSLLIIAAFFQLSDGVQAVALGTLRGMADVKIPTIITLIAYWVVGLPVAYLLAFPLELGPHGIWYGLLVSLTIAAVLLVSRFHYISKRLLRKYPAEKQTAATSA